MVGKMKYLGVLLTLLFAAMPLISMAQDATPIALAEVTPGEIRVVESTCADSTSTPATVEVDESATADSIAFQVQQPNSAGDWVVMATLLDPTTNTWGEFDQTVWTLQGDGTLLASGNAATIDCAGPTEAPATEEVGTPAAIAPSAGVFAPFAATCPADPTGTDLGSGAVTGAVATVKDGNGVVLDDSTDGDLDLQGDWQRFEIDYTFDASGAKSGDFFTVPLPPNLKTPNTGSTTLYEDPDDPTSPPIGCMSVQDGVVTVVFLDYADTHDDVTGSFFANYNVVANHQEEDQTVTTNIPGVGEVIINVPGTGVVVPDGYYVKHGWWANSETQAENPEAALVWRVSLAQQTTEDVDITITDTPPADGSWTVNCDFVNYPIWVESKPIRPVTVNPGEVEYTVVSCDPVAGLVLNVTKVPTDVSIRFQFRGDVVDTDSDFVNSVHYKVVTGTEPGEHEAQVEVELSEIGGNGSGNAIPTPTPVTPSPTPVTPTPQLDETPTPEPSVTPTVTPVTPTPQLDETPTPEPSVTPTETPVTPTPQMDETPTPEPTETPTETPVTPTVPVTTVTTEETPSPTPYVCETPPASGEETPTGNTGVTPEAPESDYPCETPTVPVSTSLPKTGAGQQSQEPIVWIAASVVAAAACATVGMRFRNQN